MCHRSARSGALREACSGIDTKRTRRIDAHGPSERASENLSSSFVTVTFASHHIPHGLHAKKVGILYPPISYSESLGQSFFTERLAPPRGVSVWLDPPNLGIAQSGNRRAPASGGSIVESDSWTVFALESNAYATPIAVLEAKNLDPQWIAAKNPVFKSMRAPKKSRLRRIKYLHPTTPARGEGGC
jgi:hypothetical protein